MDIFLQDKQMENQQIQYTLEQRKELLLEYVRENNCVPQYRTEYKQCKLGAFYKHLKSKVKSIDSLIYKEYEDNQIIKQNLDRYLQFR